MKNQKTSGKSKVQQWVENIFGVNNIFTRAEGGPVNAGQPYLVGEKGPEVVVPNQNATVLSNDDSQVMSMLLASNPQLQNISRPRAEGILRSRFPDYFA
jgi:SLT domain-containing protein